VCAGSIVRIKRARSTEKGLTLFLSDISRVAKIIMDVGPLTGSQRRESTS